MKRNALWLVGIWLTILNLLQADCAFGQVVTQTLKTFGYADVSSASIQAPLVLGADGAFYGTTRDGGLKNQGTVFKVNADGTEYIVLHSFSGADGINPYSAVYQATDGSLYGTTYAGGTNSLGTVFKLNTNGTGFAVLRTFRSSEGGNSYSSLIQGLDSALYGTTYSGGTYSQGTIFKLNTDGTAFQVLYHLGLTNGNKPRGGLLQGSDGTLFGTTSEGGSAGSYGTVFKIAPSGTGYTVLHNFGLSSTDGKTSYAGLTGINDEWLYGTTSSGGTNGWGTVFKVRTDGTGYSTLHSFNKIDGARAYASLSIGADSALYGTTRDGGTTATISFNGSGVAFKLNTNGTSYTVLHNFGVTYQDGQQPYASLLQKNTGELFGTTLAGGNTSAGTIFKLATNGTGYTVLKSFSGSGGDGKLPCQGPLAPGRDGTLYGTTSGGGAAGAGTIYSLSISGDSYNLIYSFGLTADAPRNPSSGLLLDDDGVAYCTASSGGSSGAGAVFKINTNGLGFTLLHVFSTNGIDGTTCYAGLIKGLDGSLYGATCSGGTNGYGTVFRINTDGSGYAILHHLSANEGTGPYFPLMQGSDGMLYGTAELGGTNNQGTIFKLNTNGTGFVVLRNLGGMQFSSGQFIQNNDGTLIGTSRLGGNNGFGTVFKFNRDGTYFSVLHSFAGGANDGKYCYAPLVRGSDGALYGTTDSGGVNNTGTLYRINPDGSDYQVVHSFGLNEASDLEAALMEATDGTFYGTTINGGNMNIGTVFRLLVPPTLTAVRNTVDASYVISIRRLGQQPCRLEVSTDFSQWDTLTNLSNVSGSLQITDPDIPHLPQRFFRVAAP